MKLTRGQARLLAFTAGATVANLYYAQPLLPTIAASMHVSQASTALLVTLTQLSYGVGLLLYAWRVETVRSGHSVLKRGPGQECPFP